MAVSCWEITSIVFALASCGCLGLAALRVDRLVRDIVDDTVGQTLGWHPDPKDFSKRLLRQKALIVSGIVLFVISEMFHLSALPW
jgi:hypothetical protein